MKRTLNSLGILVVVIIVALYLLGLADDPWSEVISSLAALVVAGIMSYMASKGYVKTSMFFGLLVAASGICYIYFVDATGNGGVLGVDLLPWKDAFWSIVIVILFNLGYRAYSGLNSSSL